jgi:hypothetical protein
MLRRNTRSKSALLSIATAAALLLTRSTSVHADADSAKKYLKDAQTAFDNSDPKTAGDNLSLAETELDGVADADKAPIAADIKSLRDKISAAAGSDAKNAAIKNIDDLMDTAKKSFDAPQTFDETDKAIQDALSNSDTKAALGDDAVNKYLKTLSTFRKVAHKRANEINIAAAKDQLDSAEKDWPDKQKSLSEIQNDVDTQPDAVNFQHSLDSIAALVKQLPSSDPATPALRERYSKLQGSFDTLIYKSKAAETYDRMTQYWQSYSDEYSGWDKETTPPTFASILENGDIASNLGAPKTLGLITRTDAEMENWMKDDVTRTLSTSDPKIKGFLDKIRSDRKAAISKLAGFASSAIGEAEKLDLNQDSRSRLDDLANDYLPRCLVDSDQLKPLQDRAKKLVKAFDAKTGGDAAAHAKLNDDLTSAGARAWPDMAAKVQAADDFDANAIMQNPDNFKGKLYHFKGVNNRMGWDYSPGNGYQFAMTSEGTPVAAKFDTTVKASVKDVLKRTATDLPDENYEFIASVEDVGPIIKISRATGDVKTTDGEAVGTVTATADVTVQGVRLKIVALHVGPITAAEDQGVVGADGTIGQPAQ